jgi:hypothetical protein
LFFLTWLVKVTEEVSIVAIRQQAQAMHILQQQQLPCSFSFLQDLLSFLVQQVFFVSFCLEAGNCHHRLHCKQAYYKKQYERKHSHCTVKVRKNSGYKKIDIF